VWIKILDIPYDMKTVTDLALIVGRFGTMLGCDYYTLYRMDLRWVKVWVEVVDFKVIPSYIFYDIFILFEPKIIAKTKFEIEPLGDNTTRPFSLNVISKWVQDCDRFNFNRGKED
jgi:hypothetical protein